MIGLVYVVFGEKCDRLAAHCIGYSRQYTKFPICVLTNIPEPKRDKRWKSIHGINFIISDMPSEENRKMKTSMNRYVDFTFNIYMDADSIIQNSQFDDQIELMVLDNPDLLLNHFAEYPLSDNTFQNIYLRALHQFGCAMPLQIYNGAFIGFKNNSRTAGFFETWNRYWREFGSQREMPPLACAVKKHSELKISHLPDGFFSPDSRDDNCIVQHNYNADFHSRIGIEPIELPIAKYKVDDYKFTKI